jgi:hypothetical protein
MLLKAALDVFQSSFKLLNNMPGHNLKKILVASVFARLITLILSSASLSASITFQLRSIKILIEIFLI